MIRLTEVETRAFKPNSAKGIVRRDLSCGKAAEVIVGSGGLCDRNGLFDRVPKRVYNSLTNRMNDIGHLAELKAPPDAKHAATGRISSVCG